MVATAAMSSASRIRTSSTSPPGAASQPGSASSIGGATRENLDSGAYDEAAPVTTASDPSIAALATSVRRRLWAGRSPVGERTLRAGRGRPARR